MNRLAGSLADELERRLTIVEERAELLPTFREFLERAEYAGGYMAVTGISPVVAAIVDASEGSPVESLSDDECAEIFHLRPEEVPLGDSPRIVVVNAGRQAGKTSSLLAPKCVHAAWTLPTPFLRPGQVARCVIISPSTDLSRAAFRYCKGIVESSQRISRNIVKVTSGNLADVASEIIILRRPDGRLVEIVVGAADAGGTAARSATLLWCGLDEAAFHRAENGQENDQAIFDAAMGTLRTVAGAQLWIVSTPWIEGHGLMEQLIRDHWGHAGSSVLVAARVSSYQLRGIPDNGSLREETDTDATYDREVLARPMPAGAQGFFNAAALAASLLRHPPAGPAEAKGAGGDFAFERDACAVVVTERYLGGFFAPVLVEERRASPGDIDANAETVRELAFLVAARGCKQITGDPWKRPFVREHIHAARLGFVDAPGSDEGKAETYGAFKAVVEAGRFCLAHLDPKVARYLVEQLRAVMATPIPGPGARFKLTAPRTRRLLEGVGAGKVGAHGDVGDACVKAAWAAGSGQPTASWQIPRQASHVGRQASHAPPRPGAGSSASFLRARSASAFAGRGLPGAGED